MNKHVSAPDKPGVVECFQRAVGPFDPGSDIKKIAKRNHLGYVLGSSEDFYRAYWRSAAELDQLLSQHGVEHLFIKTIRSYPTDDSNIDVVCQTEADFKKAFSLIATQGRRATYSYHEPDKAMFRSFDQGRERKPAWHLHRAVSWNGVPYLGNDGLFSGARRAEQSGVTLTVPSVSHALAINAGHALFENFVIPFGEAYDSIRLSLQVPDWDALFSLVRGFGWERGFRDYLGLIRRVAEGLKLEQGIPDQIKPVSVRLKFPVAIPLRVQCSAFHTRIFFNLGRKNFKHAFREAYAYPLFYVIEKVKMFLGHA
jgi:hypothetical protein